MFCEFLDVEPTSVLNYFIYKYSAKVHIGKNTLNKIDTKNCIPKLIEMMKEARRAT